MFCLRLFEKPDPLNESILLLYTTDAATANRINHS